MRRHQRSSSAVQSPTFLVSAELGQCYAGRYLGVTRWVMFVVLLFLAFVHGSHGVEVWQFLLSQRCELCRSAIYPTILFRSRSSPTSSPRLQHFDRGIKSPDSPYRPSPTVLVGSVASFSLPVNRPTTILVLLFRAAIVSSVVLPFSFSSRLILVAAAATPTVRAKMGSRDL